MAKEKSPARLEFANISIGINMRSPVPSITDYPKAPFSRKANRENLASDILSYFKLGDSVSIKDNKQSVNFGYSVEWGYYFSIETYYPQYFKHLKFSALVRLVSEHNSDTTFISRAFKKLRKQCADHRSFKYQ